MAVTLANNGLEKFGRDLLFTHVPDRETVVRPTSPDTPAAFAANARTRASGGAVRSPHSQDLAFLAALLGRRRRAEDHAGSLVEDVLEALLRQRGALEVFDGANRLCHLQTILE